MRDSMLCLWIYVLSMPSVISGISVQLSGSTSYPELDKPFTFTCTVRWAYNLADFKATFVSFVNERSPFRRSLFQYSSDKCNVFADRKGRHSTACGRGTTSRSSVKIYTMRINSLHTYHAMDWRCQTNIPEIRSNTIHLVIYDGPNYASLEPYQYNRIVREGNTLRVGCSASCMPKSCSYEWKQGNKVITRQSQLVEANIRRNNTGYVCTARNVDTSKYASKDLKFTVYYGPENVQLNTSSTVTVQEGDDTAAVVVLCSAVCFNSCSITWKHRNQIIRNSALLSLNAIQKSEAGVYTCTAVHSWDRKSEDKSFTLNVLYDTAITSVKLNSQSTKMTVDELTPMTLSCDVDSNPASDIKLLNNSQTLYEVNNSMTAEFTWNETGCLDTGRYTCEAGNNITTDVVNQSVQLVVKCFPRLDHRVPFQDSFKTSVGGNVTFNISVIANPEPTFTWYRLTDDKTTDLESGSLAVTNVSSDVRFAWYRLTNELTNGTDLDPTNQTNRESGGVVSTVGSSAVGRHTLINVRDGDTGIYLVVVSNGDPETDLVLNFTLVAQGVEGPRPTVQLYYICAICILLIYNL